MKGVKCLACGFVGLADQETCKKCGASLARPPAQSYIAQPQPPAAGYQTGYQQRPPSQNLKQGLAITSLVIGIVNFFTFGLLGAGAISGLTCGIVALSKARKRPTVYGGQGLAIAGVATNSFWLLFAFPIVLAIAIPNLIAARRAANEGSAIASLRSIAEAEDNYYSTRQVYGTLSDLSAANLIKPELATGTRNGYRFWIKLASNGNGVVKSFDATAVPVEYGNSGRRSFLIDETGVVRAADIHGREATRSARSLDDNSFGSADD
jgi:hypothetical protein